MKVIRRAMAATVWRSIRFWFMVKSIVRIRIRRIRFVIIWLTSLLAMELLGVFWL